MKLLLYCALIVATSGCIIQTKVTPFPTNQTYASTNPDSITFFLLERDIPTNAVRLGTVGVELSNVVPEADLQKAVRQKAAQLGANAVYRLNEGTRPSSTNTFWVNYLAFRVPEGIQSASVTR